MTQLTKRGLSAGSRMSNCSIAPHRCAAMTSCANDREAAVSEHEKTRTNESEIVAHNTHTQKTISHNNQYRKHISLSVHACLMEQHDTCLAQQHNWLSQNDRRNPSQFIAKATRKNFQSANFRFQLMAHHDSQCMNFVAVVINCRMTPMDDHSNCKDRTPARLTWFHLYATE